MLRVPKALGVRGGSGLPFFLFGKPQTEKHGNDKVDIMFEFEANEAVIVEQQKALEAALTSNPRTEKVLREIIRKFILEARKEVVQGITFKHGDPRGAAQAVRSSVYKKVFGGNLNILNSRKAHGENSYEPPRKGVSGRGGNRRPRTTLDRGKYAPLDRGFILRWLNEGVSERNIRFKVDERRSNGQWPSVAKWTDNPNTGRRGSIAARNFFRPLGDRALGTMRDNLTTAIEDELVKLLPHDK